VVVFFVSLLGVAHPSSGDAFWAFSTGFSRSSN